VSAVIVDDERLARAELKRLLARHPHVTIAGEAAGAGQAVSMIRAERPDLVFLDIQLPGMSGFDVLEQLEGDLPHVIFTTAYDQYAIRAFEVNALDYLLKPVAPERLALALERVPLAPPRDAARIFVRDGERCWVVRLSDVRLFESEGNYARVYFGNERPLIRRSLDALEQQLDAATFVRANRRQIVNLSSIERASLKPGGTLMATLRGGTTVELSRRQSRRLRGRFGL
jgi:two-component system LytT family response regulator